MPRTDYPSDKQDQYMVRFPDGMRDRLKAAAAQNKRSMNAEIVARLEASFDLDPGESPDEVRARVFSSQEEIDTLPSPGDVLGAELQRAIREAIDKKLDELNNAGFVTMLYNIDIEKDPPIFHKIPKRNREQLLSYMNRMEKKKE